MNEQTIRSGKFGMLEAGRKIDALAQRLLDQLEREPETDWICTGGTLVLRMYEDGKTYSYMVAKTVAEVKPR
jgi:hypothetical protein